MIVKQHIFEKGLRPVMLQLALLSALTGCGGGGGQVVNTIELPQSSYLDLYCPNVGIAAEECILFDPENPFARAAITDDTKWDLADALSSPKAAFYLWATALAKNPTGENQYYTALSLHKLYTQGGSELAREQAKKAYQSLLDNYFTSLTYYEGAPKLDFIPDTNFRYSDWGSGTANAGWEGGYTGDADFTPVWYLPSGSGWGAPTATLAFYQFSAGFAGNYQNLVFKVKNLPTGNVLVKFASGGGPEQEVSFDLATYATDIPGTTGWKQVTIPLSGYAGLTAYTEFGIHSGWGNGGTFLLTDVGFTGDTTGGGLVNDVDGNGTVYLYRSGTQLYSLDLRNLVGLNLHSPVGQGLTQLYSDQAEAMSALTSWGYKYDPASKTVERL